MLAIEVKYQIGTRVGDCSADWIRRHARIADTHHEPEGTMAASSFSFRQHTLVSTRAPMPVRS